MTYEVKRIMMSKYYYISGVRTTAYYYKHSDADRRTGEREKINVQKTIAHAQPLQYLRCIK